MEVRRQNPKKGQGVEKKNSSSTGSEERIGTATSLVIRGRRERKGNSKVHLKSK